MTFDPSSPFDTALPGLEAEVPPAADTPPPADRNKATSDHTCEVCGKAFASHPKLYQHRYRLHGLKNVGRARGDTAPPSVTVNLGGKSKKSGDAELEAVEARARQLVQLVAALVMLAGQPEDALDLERGSAPWAKTVAELAEYEPWLKKLAAGGDASGRVTAWITFGVATVSLSLPILLRHEALPANIASLAGQMLAVRDATPAPA